MHRKRRSRSCPSNPSRSRRGDPTHPARTYLRAFLRKIQEDLVEVVQVVPQERVQRPKRARRKRGTCQRKASLSSAENSHTAKVDVTSAPQAG